jgi:hypothetical protein
MGVDQPECGAGRSKVVEYEHWPKNKSQAFGRRAVGCNLVVLKRAPPQSHCKTQAPFSATPCEQFKVLSALVQRCDAHHFMLNGAVRNSALALHWSLKRPT